jgi:hypothetical protein
MRREAHVRFLGGAHRKVSPYPTDGVYLSGACLF